MLSQEAKKIKRSRLGCHRCKKLKIKCSEEKPACASCIKARVTCDYSIKLTWGGRPYKDVLKRKSCSTIGNFHSLGMKLKPLATGTTMSKANTIEFVSSDFSPSPNLASPIQFSHSMDSTDHSVPRNQTAGSFHQFLGIDLRFSTSLSGSSLEVVPSNTSRNPRYNDWASVTGIRPVEGSFKPTEAAETKYSALQNNFSQENLEFPSGVSPLGIPRSSNNQLPHTTQITTPEFLAVTNQINTDQLPNSPTPSRALDTELADGFDADLARIERAFPPEQRLPFYQNNFGRSPPRKDSFDSEKLELELTSVLDHFPRKHESFVQKRNELIHTVSAQYSIPPQIVPLPEILLKVPYYRQLFHFWVNVAADNLVPAPYLYKDNPFKKILPQMAMHYPGLLTTILAFAARARDDLEGSLGTHLNIIDQLLGRSCDELLKQLQDESEATSDGTFAMSLLLSSFEVVHSNDFNKHRAHATGASQIMSARTKKLRRSDDSPSALDDEISSTSSSSSLTRKNESDIAYFLLRWFVYVDVIGALSSTRDRGKYLQAYRNFERYSPVESIPHLEVDDSERDIDFILGFDPKFLPHFVNISLLIDEVEKYMQQPNSDLTCLPQYIVGAALELKEKLHKSYEAGEAKRLLIFDQLIERNGPFSQSKSKDLMQKDNILRSTNKLYYNTGLLNLYRRVYLLPRLSPLVQGLISEMTEIFEFYIDPHSTAQICTIFSLFCAGCDNLDEKKKFFYKHRFQDLVEHKNMNAVKSLVIMDRCWETGEDWITAANTLDIDLVLM